MPEDTKKPFDVRKALGVVVRENATALLLKPHFAPCVMFMNRLHPLQSRPLTYHDLEKIFIEVTPPPEPKLASQHRRHISNDLYELDAGHSFNVATMFDPSKQVELILFTLLPEGKGAGTYL